MVISEEINKREAENYNQVDTLVLISQFGQGFFSDRFPKKGRYREVPKN